VGLLASRNSSDPSPLIVRLEILLSQSYLCRSGGHVSLGLGFWGAVRYGVDTYYAPVLTAYWLYAEARQGARDMKRVGVAV
jgi:hypothetical protein